MGLILNLPGEGERFKRFYGRNVEQMPLLMAEGRNPLSAARLMQRRLETRNVSEEVGSSWTDYYFGTVDAIALHPLGRVKIVLNSQILRKMPTENQRNGMLILEEDVYNALEGQEFKQRELGKLESALSASEVKSHPIWNVVAGDKSLLNDYTDFVFAEAKKRFNRDLNMGIYLTILKESCEIWGWGIGGLESGSNLCGMRDFYDSVGFQVGVASEAQNK